MNLHLCFQHIYLFFENELQLEQIVGVVLLLVMWNIYLAKYLNFHLSPDFMYYCHLLESMNGHSASEMYKVHNLTTPVKKNNNLQVEVPFK